MWWLSSSSWLITAQACLKLGANWLSLLITWIIGLDHQACGVDGIPLKIGRTCNPNQQSGGKGGGHRFQASWARQWDLCQAPAHTVFPCVVTVSRKVRGPQGNGTVLSGDMMGIFLSSSIAVSWHLKMIFVCTGVLSVCDVKVILSKLHSFT